MVELGCSSAINFDGGGSTFLFVDGNMIFPNKLSRTFPNVLIWKNLP
jgi:prepilin-type processing-associated H-X9-DG protein